MLNEPDPFPLDPDMGEREILVVAVSLVLALMRILGATSATYQAAAHLWVGVLIGLATLSAWPLARLLWGLVGALAVVEVGCMTFGTAQVF